MKFKNLFMAIKNNLKNRTQHSNSNWSDSWHLKICESIFSCILSACNLQFHDYLGVDNETVPVINGEHLN